MTAAGNHCVTNRDNTLSTVKKSIIASRARAGDPGKVSKHKMGGITINQDNDLSVVEE